MAEDQENETPQEPAAPEPAAPEAAAPDGGEGASATATSGEAPAATASAPKPEPVEQLPPKERRRKARSAHSGTARAPRSAEERHAERLQERKRKATRRRARRLQERAKRTESRGGATPSPQTAAPAREEGTRKVRQGIVVSDKADKTITVRIDVARRHRRYEKIVRSSSTLHAHDESNEAHEGDTVRVIESRPLSRTKRWRLVDVLERAR
jgi:small subunit ribosomal protein S17